MKVYNERTQKAIDDAVAHFAHSTIDERFLRKTFSLIHSDGRICGIESCRDALRNDASRELLKALNEFTASVTAS